MAASNAVTNWTEAETAERDAAPLGKGRLRPVADEREVDRYHNREELSPEAMSKALAELRETVESLEERVAAAEAGSEGVVGAAKGLGLSMLSMGDSLAKRISSLEESAAVAEAASVAEPPPPAETEAPALFTAPAPRPPVKSRRVQLALGVGAAVIIAAAAGFFLRPHSAPASAAPTQALYSPDAPAPHS